MDPSPGDPDVEQAALLVQLGRIGRLADRQDPLLERRQEHGIPLEPLRPVVGQQLDARAGRAVGLGGGPAVDLGEEGLDAAGRVGGLELAADLEQREQGAMALTSLLPGRGRRPA